MTALLLPVALILNFTALALHVFRPVEDSTTWVIVHLVCIFVLLVVLGI